MAAPSSAMASRTWAASSAVLRLLARVLGLIASCTLQPAGSAWRSPSVQRLGSSQHAAASAGSAASASLSAP
jgi:hypothetical protein